MTKTNKHILLVTSEFPPLPGGIGNHAYNLAKHLNLHGFSVQVIADQRSVSGKEEKEFDNLLQFKVLRVALRKIRMRMYFRRLAILFKEIQFSETVIASGKFSLWIVAFASLFYKRKFIAVVHGSEVNFKNKLLNKSIVVSLKRFDKIIAVSNYTKRLVENIHENILVIPNGIDTSKLEKANTKEVKLIGYPKLITVGNLTERKGQLNVIKQIPALLKKYPNLHYHCVGLPTQKELFLKITEELNVIKQVTFHGRLTDEALMACLKASDIFVMLSSETSTGDIEGFGIALIEANYFGIPSIGAKGCGIEDAINDTVSGKLVAYNKTKDLEEAIGAILENYEEYSVHAKEWSLKHAWKQIVNDYIKELE